MTPRNALVCVLAPLVLAASAAMAVADPAAPIPAAARGPARGGQTLSELARLRASNVAMTADLAAKTAELDKLRAAAAQAVDQSRDQVAELAQLRFQLAAETDRARGCAAKNARLQAFAEELLSDYRKVNLGRIVASRELVVGLGRVKLENLIQDREERIRANRCEPGAEAAPPAKAGG